jgi:hypothetical protein
MDTKIVSNVRSSEPLPKQPENHKAPEQPASLGRSNRPPPNVTIGNEPRDLQPAKVQRGLEGFNSVKKRANAAAQARMDWELDRAFDEMLPSPPKPGTLAFKETQKQLLMMNATRNESPEVKHARMLVEIAQKQEDAGVGVPGTLAKVQARYDKLTAQHEPTYQRAIDYASTLPVSAAKSLQDLTQAFVDITAKAGKLAYQYRAGNNPQPPEQPAYFEEGGIDPSRFGRAKDDVPAGTPGAEPGAKSPPDAPSLTFSPAEPVVSKSKAEVSSEKERLRKFEKAAEKEFAFHKSNSLEKGGLPKFIGIGDRNHYAPEVQEEIHFLVGLVYAEGDKLLVEYPADIPPAEKCYGVPPASWVSGRLTGGCIGIDSPERLTLGPAENLVKKKAMDLVKFLYGSAPKDKQATLQAIGSKYGGSELDFHQVQTFTQELLSAVMPLLSNSDKKKAGPLIKAHQDALDAFIKQMEKLGPTREAHMMKAIDQHVAPNYRTIMVAGDEHIVNTQKQVLAKHDGWSLPSKRRPRD